MINLVRYLNRDILSRQILIEALDQLSADIREIRELLAVLMEKFVKPLELEKVKGNLIFRHLLCQIKRGGGKIKISQMKSFCLCVCFYAVCSELWIFFQAVDPELISRAPKLQTHTL